MDDWTGVVTELGISNGPARNELRTDVTSAYLDLLTAAVGGSVSTWATSVVEHAAGVWARALSTADVPPGVPLDARLLAEIGRDLARKGEAVYLLDARMDGRFRLLRASTTDVWGDTPDPADWWYRLTLQGPRHTRTVTAPAAAVVHVRYAAEDHSPQRGIPPLRYAALTGSLHRYLETNLGYEAAGPVATLIALPEGHDGKNQNTTLAADIAGARGRCLLPETTRGGAGDREGRPKKDYEPSRLGANPPSALVALRRETENSVLSCFGIPAPLGPAGISDGTAAREGARRLWALTIQPLAALIAAELSRVLAMPVTLSHSQPQTSVDVAAKARALHVAVQAGMNLTEAKRFIGYDG